MSNVKYVKIIFGVICSIGCAVQLFTVTHNFLQFKVQTEIVEEYPSLIEIPEIDFIIPLANLVNMSGLYLKHPNEMSEVCSRVLKRKNLKINASINEYLLHCSDINQIMATITYALSGILTVGDIEQLTPDPASINGIYIDDEHNNLLANKSCTTQKYFSGMFIFFRISCRNNSHPIIKRLIQTRGANSYLICLSIKTNYTFGFNLSPSDSLLATRLRQYVIIEYKRVAFRMLFVKFRRKISKSLPLPYVTNCQNYDRSRTFIECINTKLLSNKSSPSLYIDNLIRPGEYPGHLKFADDRLADFDRKASHAIYNKCSELIDKPECNSIVYDIETQDHSDVMKRFKKKLSQFVNISLCLEAQFNSDTIIRVKPEITFIQYLIYIGSTLGLWFCISIYVHFQQIIECFSKMDLVKLLSCKEKEATPVVQFNQQIPRINNVFRIHPS